jgi:hypothetical protein
MARATYAPSSSNLVGWLGFNTMLGIRRLIGTTK